MALLHQAQLHPTKLELLSEWAPTQPWFAGDAAAEFTNVAAFRFDDPAGEVGVETILLRVGDGPIMQVPLTYRGAPLEGAEAFLLGTMDHSVLGKRWVYDGPGDPVYVQTTANAALNGGHQAELVIQTADGQVGRAPNALVSGTGTGGTTVDVPSAQAIVVNQEGTDTVVTAGSLRLRVHRVVADDGADDRGVATESGRTESSSGSDTTAALTGTWTDSPQERELILVAQEQADPRG